MNTGRDPYKLIILAVLMGWSLGSLGAQNPFDADRREEAEQLWERVEVFTDRSMYAVNETIKFVAELRTSESLGAIPWSSVLYVELVASTGEALAQGKFRIFNGKVQGSLAIPMAALTGNYYLKSYTRWMRNFGPQSFSYIPLKLINPFRKEVLNPHDNGNQSLRKSKVGNKEGILVCSASSSIYTPGQEAILKVKAKEGVFADQISFNVTVVPEGSIDLAMETYEVSPPIAGDSFKVVFLPDLGNAVSISGTVVGPNQEPAPYKTLHFSMLGESQDYFATLSDRHGRFILATPTGIDDVQEFFVTPEQEEGNLLEVRIDQEYDTREPGFTQMSFELSEGEYELARKLAFNMQLTKAFHTEAPSEDILLKNERSPGQEIPFYGTSVNRLLIDDYVRLPNLEEIFINLVPKVQFYREKGKKKITILSENNSIGVYKPLIMIDNISVFDHEAVLALSPEKIERIDLIDDIYIKGNVAFGGVLAIYSRKGDMAGIDLPAGSYFFDYQSFYKEGSLSEPPPAGEGRIPDSRNTFLWAGDQVLEQGRQVDIPFQAPRSSGSYVALIRGISPDGQVYSASAKFRVE